MGEFRALLTTCCFFKWVASSSSVDAVVVVVEFKETVEHVVDVFVVVVVGIPVVLTHDAENTGLLI